MAVSNLTDSSASPYLFPIEISEVISREILLHSNGFTDLVNLSMTCNHWHIHIRNLWKKLCYYAFSVESIQELIIDTPYGNFAKVYWDLLQKSRMVSGLEIGGAWVTTPSYYSRDRQTDSTLSHAPIYLITVCHLENHAIFKEVFPGEYEIIWRIKQSSVKGYAKPVPNADLSYRIENGEVWSEYLSLGKVYVFNNDNVNKWIELSTGCIKMKRYGRIESRFMSLVPNWQESMWFDCVLLKPIKLGKDVQPNFVVV